MNPKQLLQAFVLAAVLTLCFSAPLAGQDDDVIRIDTSLVTVNVSVTDHKNRHLADLKLDDFLVTDEGKQVKPHFFGLGGPASIVFLVDISSSMQNEKWRSLKTGLKKFLANADQDNDYTLIAFNSEAQLIVSSVTSAELWKEFQKLRPDGETAVYDAVLMGLKALDRAPKRHKALVLLSDGEDNRSKAALDSVQQEVFAHRVTIYPVGLLSGRLSPFRPKGKSLLKELAEVSGGVVFFPAPNEIRDVLGKINAEVRNQYSFGYYPPEKAPGWRNIEVMLQQTPGELNLRYQRRYLMR